MIRRITALAAVAVSLFTAPIAAAERYESARISVEVSGQGPDVVLIPGLASSRAVYDETLAALQATHRVHRVQVKGFAGEAAPAGPPGAVFADTVEAVATYLEKEKIPPAAIVGHSMGGAAALALAARHPERVSRVVVIDALSFFSLLFGPQMTADAARPAATQARDAMIAQPADTFAASQSTTMLRLTKSPEGRTLGAGWSVASDRATMANAMYDVMTTDLRPELAAIKAPTTILYAYDPLMMAPPSMLDGLYSAAYANLPGVKLVRIDGALHFIMWDQPAAYLTALNTALK